MRRYLRHPFLPLVVLLVVSAIILIRLDRPLIRGDGTAYLAWVDTFVRDRDIDLANQFERLRPVNTYQVTWDDERQRYVDIFPFGVGFVQAPFYAVGGVLAEVGWPDANPDYFLQMQGVQQAYSLALMGGANLMALAAIGLAWWMARRLTDSWSAALVTGGVFAGTPLLYYSTVSPLNSHNPGAFLTTCFAALLVVLTGAFRGPDETPPASRRAILLWIALGAVAGLMVLVRWQLLLVAVCAWALLAWERRWRGLAIATLAAAVVLLPLPLIWNEMFGKPFVVPYDETTGDSFLRLPVNAHRVLFRTVHYSPVLALSLLGIPFLWQRDRRWALLAVAVIGAQVLLNGSTRDWYDGDSFGARRMSELYPFYVLLAAALLGYLPRGSALRERRAIWPAAGRVALAGLIVYSMVFLFAFFVFSWTNPQGVFADSPESMWSYFLDHPQRRAVIDTLFQTHLGPPAWSRPGP